MTPNEKAALLRDLIGFINDGGDGHGLYIGDERPGPNARTVQERLAEWASELDTYQDFFNSQTTEQS